MYPRIRLIQGKQGKVVVRDSLENISKIAIVRANCKIEFVLRAMKAPLKKSTTRTPYQLQNKPS
jgi:hypothetical protein